MAVSDPLSPAVVDEVEVFAADPSSDLAPASAGQQPAGPPARPAAKVQSPPSPATGAGPSGIRDESESKAKPNPRSRVAYVNRRECERCGAVFRGSSWVCPACGRWHRRAWLSLTVIAGVVLLAAVAVVLVFAYLNRGAFVDPGVVCQPGDD